MVDNNITAQRYLKYINDNYKMLKSKMKAFCKEKDYQWDEDIWSDTYLKVYDKILKSGIKDDTEDGFADYTFIAFKTNIKRERQYKRISSRDFNYTSDEVNDVYETYYNNSNDPEIDKIRSDLFKDYMVKRIVDAVSTQFGDDKARHFASKYLIKGNTYRKMAERTGIKGIRNEIIEMKRWVIDNISKEELKNDFLEEYGDLL